MHQKLRLKVKTNWNLQPLMFNPVTQKNETIQLVPMGKTILRQVSFKKE